MPKTRVQKNKYAREWRKSTYEEKRFNKPLRQFLELKYRDVFNEYNWFYRSLNDQYPDAKDLTKTKVFKAWKSRQLNCESSDDEPPESEHTETERNETEPGEAERSETEVNQTERNETEPDEAERSETEVNQTERNETEPDEAERSETKVNQTERNETEPDEAGRSALSIALEETVPNDNFDIGDLDIDQIDTIIQRVINELEEEEAVRDLLNDNQLVQPNYQDQDEGIDLDIDLELAAIIEPFDYQLEVEGLDY